MRWILIEKKRERKKEGNNETLTLKESQKNGREGKSIIEAECLPAFNSDEEE